VCAATNTYTASLKSTGTTLKSGGLSKQTLDAVVSDAKTSTQAFADSIESLGPPPVADSQAKDIFENLRSQLQKDADSIQKATANVSGVSEVLQAVSAVAGTLAQLTAPATAMTLMAVMSVTVTLALAALGRRSAVLTV